MRRSRLVAIVVVGAIVAASSPLRITAAAADPVTVNDYEFVSGFSGVQGQGQWSYLQWDGTRYSTMTWDAANGYWRGSCTYCIISRGAVHPDANDSVIAWTAPRAGTVAVRGTMDHRGAADLPGDGVRTLIRKQSGTTTTKVWPSADYQTIKPNFMAQHIFKTTVNAGDILYFHVNKLGTTNHDTLHWDPRISYGYEPKFTLDQAELVMNPDDFGRAGILRAHDSSLSAVPNGTSFDFYHSGDWGAVLSKFTGTLAQPAQRKVYADGRLVTAGSTERWWIANTYRTAEGHLLAFCHIENADPGTIGWWALGLAYSTDNGSSFVKLGHIVGQHVKGTAETGNIYGIPYVVKDGYFHIYYGDVTSAESRSVEPAVARAPVSEVLDAAKRGTASPWHKYYNGGWTEPGLNGNASTPIIPDGVLYSTHGDAAYSTYLGKYLISGHTGHLGKGVYLTFSDDAVNYELPSWIQSSQVTDRDSLSPYETIVNLDGSDNGVVGQSFYVYYGYRFKMDGVDTDAEYATYWRWLYRQKVTLNRAGFDRNSYDASTDFTGKSGEAGWRYLEYDDGLYKGTTWDSTQYRWTGSDPYLLVSAGGGHPAGGNDSVRAWTAPRAGTVRVTALNGISSANGSGADGVGVKIVKHPGGTQVWPASGYQPVAPGTTTPFGAVEVTVAKGDSLYFHINQNGNNSYDTTGWVPVISYTGASRITYDGWVDYSGTQGQNQWRYQEYDGTRYTDMAWDAERSRWQGSATYLLVGPTSQHADAGRDSVRAWVAPKDGTVVVTSVLGDITVANGTGADGVKVKVMKNADNVWPATGYRPIGPGGSATFPATTVTVAAGDTLYFHVNQNGGTAYDTTGWVPAVAYMGP
jgi:hypothetical protein